MALGCYYTPLISFLFCCNSNGASCLNVCKIGCETYPRSHTLIMMLLLVLSWGCSCLVLFMYVLDADFLGNIVVFIYVPACNCTPEQCS